MAWYLDSLCLCWWRHYQLLLYQKAVSLLIVRFISQRDVRSVNYKLVNWWKPKPIYIGYPSGGLADCHCVLVQISWTGYIQLALSIFTVFHELELASSYPSSEQYLDQEKLKKIGWTVRVTFLYHTTWWFVTPWWSSDVTRMIHNSIQAAVAPHHINWSKISVSKYILSFKYGPLPTLSYPLIRLGYFRLNWVRSLPSWWRSQVARKTFPPCTYLCVSCWRGFCEGWPADVFPGAEPWRGGSHPPLIWLMWWGRQIASLATSVSGT